VKLAARRELRDLSEQALILSGKISRVTARGSLDGEGGSVAASQEALMLDGVGASSMTKLMSALGGRLTA